MVVSDPGLPTFFSTSLVVPSGSVNSTAVISPSVSLPVQVRVTVYGGVPVEGFKAKSVHSGVVFPCGVGVDVGVFVGALIGVFVGVLVGVLVGVFVGVPVPGTPVFVGVGVFTVIVKDTLQALLTAFGITCGTFGATGFCVSSFVDVKYATTPSPTVMMVTAIKYQYFLKNLISF